VGRRRSCWEQGLSGGLQDDPELGVKGEAIKQEVPRAPGVVGLLHVLWSQMIAWTRGDPVVADSISAAKSCSVGAR